MCAEPRFLTLSAVLGLMLAAAVSGIARADTSPDGMWAHIEEPRIASPGLTGNLPRRFRTVALQSPDADATYALRAALRENAVVYLPLPGGTFGRFVIEESSMMAADLAARYPELKTYSGYGLDDRTASVRFDITPAGFHAIVISGDGTVLIDPYPGSASARYMTYFARDVAFTDIGQYLRDDVLEDWAGVEATVPTRAHPASGANLKTYDAAIAATGEFTASVGGTKAHGMAAIVTILSRVNAIYEREVAITLKLVTNNDDVVYTDGTTDPYTDDNSSSLLGQNQSNLDSVIGSGNYDIGHVLSSSGGGLAMLSSVCKSWSKAQGTTSSPVPHDHYITTVVVTHEMGHQFGSHHTFNATSGGCDNERNSSTAYEPGSGSTLMSYAGLCGIELIQTRFDPYFHAISLDKIIEYTTTGYGGNCGSLSATGNTPPVVNAGADYTIPHNTPFTLTGSATDADGDPLLYNWEQFDRGSASSPAFPPWIDQGDNPLMRTFPGVSASSRSFPRLSDILDGDMTIGEALPTTNRSMNFRLTARDGRAGGGGVGNDSIVLDVTTGAGPFDVTAAIPPPFWIGNTAEQVSWNVAGTNMPPVSCANVDILLSCNGGATFPRVLAAGTPNDGIETVTVPNTPRTTAARIKVACTDNVFFDISSVDFTISPGAGGTVGDCAEDRDMEVLLASFTNDRVLRFDGQSGEFVSTFLPVINNPGGLTFGPDGHLYVSSSGDDSVRRFNAVTGELMDVFVRPGSDGLSGAGALVFGLDANLYVVSSHSDSVMRYDGLTGQSLGAFVASSSGGLQDPAGLTFGSDGHLYVSSGTNSEVLRYDGATGAFIDVFVTSGSGGLSGPNGLVFGDSRVYGAPFAADDNLYVASSGTDSVMRFDRDTGAFLDAFVASGSGGLKRPRDLGFWPCYVSSVWGNCLHVTHVPNATSGAPDGVLRYDAQTGAFIDVFVAADDDGPDNPTGIFLWNTNTYVSSSATNSVRRYDGFFEGDLIDDFVASGSTGRPLSMVRGPDGKLYVSFLNNSVGRFDGSTGAFVDVFVISGSGGLAGPFGIAFGPDGHLYVGSRTNHSVLRYDRMTGDFIDAFVPTGSGGLAGPNGILFDAQGRLYVASETNHNVLRYDQAGAFIDVFVSAGSGGLGTPAGMNFDADGNLYVSSRADHSVKRYTSGGAYIDSFVSSGSGGLSSPYGLVFGPDGELFVVSQGTNSVLSYNGNTGAFVEEFAVHESVNLPTALLFNPITAVPHTADFDVDGVPDHEDNCRRAPNPEQRDTDGDGYGNYCDADLNNDCIVNFGDVAAFKSVFLTADPDADFDGNGSVTFGDLAILKSQFLSPPGPNGAGGICIEQ